MVGFFLRRDIFKYFTMKKNCIQSPIYHIRIVPIIFKVKEKYTWNYDESKR